MTYSEFTITFNSNIAINDIVNIRVGTAPKNITSFLKETFVNSRQQSYQTTIAMTPEVVDGNITANMVVSPEGTAQNFLDALELDYNGRDSYELSISGASVTVKSRIANVNFYTPTSPALPVGASLTINNFSGSIFALDSLTLSEATNPCSHYKASLLFNETAQIIEFNNGTIINPNSDNPYEREFLRGQGFKYEATSASGQVVRGSLGADNIPQVLSVSNFELQINPSPNGATLNAIKLSETNTTIEYSLNNVNWQTSNQFTGLAAGNYTLYIRDNLGCNINTEFSISETNSLRTAYFKIPKSNAIRFANRITYGNCGNYQNSDNSLSVEEDYILPHEAKQLFNSCDVPTTQFQSNYTNHTIKVIKKDGTEINVPVSQVTENRNLKDRRDARKYNRGNGKTGVYFISGNLYDYDTNADIGDYELNGLLPDWGQVGNYFFMDGAWHLIEDIVTDQELNYQVLEISNVYEGSDVLVNVQSIYDLENYDEFEFTIDMDQYINDIIQVQILATDDDFDDLELLSEKLDVRLNHTGTVAITYKNRSNTDINYSRGLEHTIRVRVEKITARPLDESETNKTDNSARLIDGTVYEVDEFIFSPQTTELMRKLVQALSHDIVSINGISYVKNDSIEVDGPLEDTNLYDVTAVMIKTNTTFSSNLVQGANASDATLTEVPGLIETDDGYISYS